MLNKRHLERPRTVSIRGKVAKYVSILSNVSAMNPGKLFDRSKIIA